MRLVLVFMSLLGSTILGSGPGHSAHEMAATPGFDQSASPYLVGDGAPLLPTGRLGVLDVISVGVPVKWFVPIVLRNNTDETMVLNNVHGVARDTSGTLIATGETGSFISPNVISVGQVAIAVVYFNSQDHLPPATALEFELDAEPATDSLFRQDLEIDDATPGEERIVGLARNDTDESLVGQVSVIGVCLNADGAIRGWYQGFGNQSDLAPGETAPFDARFDGIGPCDGFLIGASGYKKL